MIKYKNITIANSSITNERKRLISQIWKLIPMREHDEDWQSHLITVTEEIAGLGKVLLVSEDPNFLILLAKLEGLDTDYSYKEDFMLYRKTVFRCIDLLVKVLSDEQS